MSIEDDRRLEWNSRRITLDPGITALVLRGAQLNGSGWRMAVRVRARRAQRWRTRGLMIAEGCVLAVLLAAVAGALYLAFWTG